MSAGRHRPVPMIMFVAIIVACGLNVSSASGRTNKKKHAHPSTETARESQLNQIRGLLEKKERELQDARHQLEAASSSFRAQLEVKDRELQDVRRELETASSSLQEQADALATKDRELVELRQELKATRSEFQVSRIRCSDQQSGVAPRSDVNPA